MLQLETNLSEYLDELKNPADGLIRHISETHLSPDIAYEYGGPFYDMQKAFLRGLELDQVAESAYNWLSMSLEELAYQADNEAGLIYTPNAGTILLKHPNGFYFGPKELKGYHRVIAITLKYGSDLGLMVPDWNFVELYVPGIRNIKVDLTKDTNDILFPPFVESQFI